MFVQNISTNCCPKPKQNFNGATISKEAMKILTKRIAKHPGEMDAFKEIGKMDVNIEVVAIPGCRADILKIKEKADNGFSFMSTIKQIDKLKESIQKFINSKKI